MKPTMMFVVCFRARKRAHSTIRHYGRFRSLPTQVQKPSHTTTGGGKSTEAHWMRIDVGPELRQLFLNEYYSYCERSGPTIGVLS